MCFSAIVQQRAKKLGIMFQARVQTEDYADIFQRRLNGEKILIGRGMEAEFIENPETEAEQKIRDCILKWHKFEAKRLLEEIAKQSERRSEAQQKLATKPTKKAENDLRVSTSKIEKMTKDLARHEAINNLTESDDRIFPRSYASMVCVDHDGNKIVRPVRYLLRPHNKDENFDIKFGGCYNARRDALLNVPWWRDALGKRHGLICVRKFFEYVAREDYRGGDPAFSAGGDPSLSGDGRVDGANLNSAEEGSLEVRFAPANEEWLLVPTLWDEWRAKDGRITYSTAIVTDVPLKEVSMTGHDRTPIFLTQAAAEQWLALESADPKLIDAILDQKHPPNLTHKVRRAGG